MLETWMLYQAPNKCSKSKEVKLPTQMRVGEGGGGRKAKQHLSTKGLKKELVQRLVMDDIANEGPNNEAKDDLMVLSGLEEGGVDIE
eukprot:11843261-Ditylum_brightwellii.AAC.1